MSKVSTFLQRFFWFAFAAFLTASIAHVAYFFRAYEPQTDGRDLLWWGVSYAIALSIDVTIFLLSVTVANLHRRKRASGLISSVWVFIIGLAVLSFYINFKYAQHFASSFMMSPTDVTLPWAGSIGDINPYIASMFQVLAIAYTWIADKIVADEKPKSADELEQEANELEKKLAQQKRIAAMKRDMVEETGGLIGSIGGTLKRAKREFTGLLNEGHNELQNNIIEGTITEVKAQDTEKQNEPIHESYEEVKTQDGEVYNEGIDAGINEIKTPDGEGQTSPQLALTQDILDVLNFFPNLGALLSTSQKTATYNQVSEALNVSLKLVANRVKDGTLKRSPRNDKLILITSVLDWAKMLYASNQNERKARALSPVKLISNGHIDEPIPDVITLAKGDDRAS